MKISHCCLLFPVVLLPSCQNQHDVLCVLLMIRLNSEHRSLMARRRVPCLDDYLDRLNLALWPRFKVGVQGTAAYLLSSMSSCS
jgi:hypothetical protein